MERKGKESERKGKKGKWDSGLFGNKLSHDLGQTKIGLS